MNILIICVVFVCVAVVRTAPVPKQSDTTAAKSTNRQGKSLNYYDYVQPSDAFVDYGAPAVYDDAAATAADDDEDDYTIDYDQNELSRALPKRKRVRRPFNSPIYYIRLPPQPYMFVPGFGYVSQPPPPNAVQQFLNVPVSFVANGKPANIYQWSGVQQFPTAAAPTAPPPPPPTHAPAPAAVARPKPKPDSTIHRLPGQYAFNGKPEDIFVLRDSYNSLYSDALQNFYP